MQQKLNSKVMCLKEWWKTCVVLCSLALISILTGIWVPLWIIPLLLWLFGLRLYFQQSIHDSSKNLAPSERAVVLQEENESCEEIDWNKCLIVTCAGKQFPSCYKRPLDERVSNGMCRALADLVETFEASTGYTHGQKFYVIFSPRNAAPARLRHYTKKIQVVAALSSFFSARFLMQLQHQKWEEGETELKMCLENRTCFYFDGNAFNVESPLEALNFFLNASQRLNLIDGVRRLALLHFVPYEIDGLTPQQLIKRLSKDRGVEWNKQPSYLKYGNFVKRSAPVEIDDSSQCTFNNDELYDASLRIPVKLYIETKSLYFNQESMDFLLAEVHSNSLSESCPQREREKSVAASAFDEVVPRDLLEVRDREAAPALAKEGEELSRSENGGKTKNEDGETLNDLKPINDEEEIKVLQDGEKDAEKVIDLINCRQLDDICEESKEIKDEIEENYESKE